MRRTSLIGSLCLVASLAIAATIHAAVTQEGGVVITPTNIDVGNTQLGDGTLRITAPTALSIASLNVARNVPNVQGRVFVDSGMFTVTQSAAIGEVGRGSLEIASPGIFDASTLTIGGVLTNATAAEGLVAIHGTGAKLVTRGKATVGEYGIGELRISDGAQANGGVQTTQLTSVIANRLGSIGTARVDGAGSAWNAGVLTVGSLGAGSLYITNGGSVTSSSSIVSALSENPIPTGSVVIDGPGSRWTTAGLTIGDRGTADVRVTGGGILDIGSDGRSQTVLGRQAGSYGRLLVSGPDSKWIDSQVATIGQSGVGELIIDGGALVATGGALIGMSTGGEGLARVSGPLTRWQVGTLQVGGANGRGSLEITDGATVSTTSFTVLPIGVRGGLTLDQGRLAMRVDSSLTNAGVIEGDGEIAGNVNNSGTGSIYVDPGQHLKINLLTNSGRIEVTNGELEIRDKTTNSSTGRLIADDATLRWRGDGLNTSGAVQITGGVNRVYGKMTNSGVVTITGGSRTTFYDAVNNLNQITAAPGTTTTMLSDLQGKGIGGGGEVFLEGLVSPAGSASGGVMDFGGDVYLGGASRLQINLDGPVPGAAFDQFNSDGAMHLGGALTLGALSELGANATFTIVRTGELFGQFSSVPEIGANIGAGVLFNGITYDYNHDEVRVSLVQSLPGDFDVSGAVDGFDFLKWQRETESPAEEVGVGADANSDGMVDLGDLSVWQASVVASAPAQVAVPESATASLALLGFLGVNLGRRVGRRF